MDPRKEHTDVTRLSTKQIDAVKGMYILLIVAGHNIILGGLVPEFRAQLYNFHVSGFLLLPFLFKSKPVNASFLSDRIVRYLVPFAAFYTASSLLFFVFLSQQTTITSWLSSYYIGLLVGSHTTVKAGSGLALFWFLPTLLSLVTIRAIASTSIRLERIVLVFCVIAHLIVGAAPEVMKSYVPMGLMIAAFMYPLGVLFEALWASYRHLSTCQALVLSFLISLACIYASYTFETHINLGAISLYSIARPIELALHDAYMIFVFLTMLALCEFAARLRFLSFIGQHSLVIYLSHSVYFHGLLTILNKIGLETDGWINGIAIFIVTLIMSLVTAIIIEKNSTIRSLLMPKTLNQWPLFSPWR